jgi:hypothetical protein
MAKTYFSSQISNASNALFRLWMQAIHDTLIAGGWVRTTDTGQIDYATAVVPSAGAVAGYSMYRSNDGADEIYIKFEFGSYTGGATFPNVYITVGWGSNGTGTIVDGLAAPFTNVLPRREYYFSTVNSTAAGQLVSAGAGYFAMAFRHTSNSTGWYFSLERTRDENGDQKGDEFVVYGISATTASTRVVNKTTGLYPNITQLHYIVHDQLATAVQTGEIGVGFMFGVRGRFTNPLMVTIGCYTGAFSGADNVFPIETYGVVRDYIVVFNYSYIFFGQTSFQCLMLWE